MLMENNFVALWTSPNGLDVGVTSSNASVMIIIESVCIEPLVEVDLSLCSMKNFFGCSANVANIDLWMWISRCYIH